ncbi:RTA1-like protein 7 [Elsinoe fawcettii]|nr:RTA1-like protein 7 [Elsinoe fawcettii]
MAGSWSLYPYDPIEALPIVFAIIIAILGAFNVYQNFFRYKWQRFGFIMTWASTVWVAAFICRAISVRNVQSVSIFIAQYVMVLAGPPLYAAAESFILGRILAYLPYHAPIHPGRVLSTFFVISVLVEVLCNTGASKSIGRADPDDAEQIKVGVAMYKAGFVLQCVLESSFMSLTAYVHFKAKRTGTLTKNIRTMVYMLYLTSSMILLRTIVRTIEAFEKTQCAPSRDNPLGYCGYLSTHEWPLYVLECANVTLFVCFLTYFTPGAYLPKSHKVFLDPLDGKTERLGPGFQAAEKRPLFATALDPFNLVGIVTGRGHKMTNFWEEQWPEYVGQAIPKDGEEVRASNGKIEETV